MTESDKLRHVSELLKNAHLRRPHVLDDIQAPKLNTVLLPTLIEHFNQSSFDLQAPHFHYFRELLNSLPILSQKILEESQERKIVFLARDAELLYDFMLVERPYLRDSFLLLPASIPLLLHLKDSNISLNTIQDFFQSNGINLNALHEYLFVDTGFKGTAFSLLEDLFRNLEALTDKPFTKQCVFLRSSNRTYAELNLSSSLKFSDYTGGFKQLISQITTLVEPEHREKFEFDVAFIVPIAIQQLPHYSKSFNTLNQDNIAIHNPDISVENVTDLNPESHNPFDALVIQIMLTSMVQTKSKVL
jgi:hypothetical protein